MAGDPHTSHLDAPTGPPNYVVGCLIILFALLLIAAMIWFVTWTNKAAPLPDAWSPDAFIGSVEDTNE